jgi:hypothetical protein
MAKKLLVVSAFCGVCALAIIFFASPIDSYLSSEGEYNRAIFSWVLAMLVLAAAGIPFGIYIFHLSNWIDKIKQDSPLYTDKKDKP